MLKWPVKFVEKTSQRPSCDQDGSRGKRVKNRSSIGTGRASGVAIDTIDRGSVIVRSIGPETVHAEALPMTSIKMARVSKVRIRVPILASGMRAPRLYFGR